MFSGQYYEVIALPNGMYAVAARRAENRSYDYVGDKDTCNRLAQDWDVKAQRAMVRGY